MYSSKRKYNLHSMSQWWSVKFLGTNKPSTWTHRCSHFFVTPSPETLVSSSAFWVVGLPHFCWGAIYCEQTTTVCGSFYIMPKYRGTYKNKPWLGRYIIACPTFYWDERLDMAHSWAHRNPHARSGEQRRGTDSSINSTLIRSQIMKRPGHADVCAKWWHFRRCKSLIAKIHYHGLYIVCSNPSNWMYGIATTTSWNEHIGKACVFLIVLQDQKIQVGMNMHFYMFNLKGLLRNRYMERKWFRTIDVLEGHGFAATAPPGLCSFSMELQLETYGVNGNKTDDGETNSGALI